MDSIIFINLSMLHFIHNIWLSSQRGLLLVHHVNSKKPSKMAQLQPNISISSGQGKLENQLLYTNLRVVFQNYQEAATLLSREGKDFHFGLFCVLANYTFN